MISLEGQKGNAMRKLMLHGNACGDHGSLQGIDVCSLSWKYARRTTANVLQTLHYLAHCPPALSRYLHAQCLQLNRISFEWERCKCFGGLSGRFNSRDEWLSYDLYTLKRFLIFGAVYVFCASSDAWSERRVAIALLLFTPGHRLLTSCWSRDCFKTLLLSSAIVWMFSSHTFVDSSCTIVCWTDSMFCSDFEADSIFCRESLDDSVIGGIYEGDSLP